MKTHNKKHYFLVGTFTIICITLMIFIGVWLSFGLQKKEINQYTAIFHESVDGLYNNGPVKFNGVSIGSITKISLDRKHPGNTIIDMDINVGTPITTDTYATIKSQGITGLSYISLQIDNPKSKQILVTPKTEPPYTVIPTKPSLFSNITTQVTHVSTNIGKLTDHISRLFDKNNIRNINKTLENIQTTSQNLSNVTAKANKVIQQSSSTVNKLNSNTLPLINKVLLPNLIDTVSQLNSTSQQLSQLLTTLNRNPSALVRGSNPPKPGPGE